MSKSSAEYAYVIASAALHFRPRAQGAELLQVIGRGYSMVTFSLVGKMIVSVSNYPELSSESAIIARITRRSMWLVFCALLHQRALEVSYERAYVGGNYCWG